ncbi:Aldehyde dehydrogenase [Patulibacter medicamentivorans]|uniref:Aldehyde dehydrogenase n=1 Tax=Patulibacter medicamentivorans TaxID=1097667 RepID=H0E6M1_9ACTN|nr:aldehyde dehydrogenase family protein [Patulibacter medicamentivorans]EHN10668.1 Aldehyde dehydrogenase [Patulibacter medicamentivorans]
MTAAASSAVAEIVVASPTDGTTLARMAVTSPLEVAAAAERLRAAQPDWERRGPAGRAQALRRLRDWLLDHEDELLDLYQRETGKPHQEALLELMTGVDIINYYADNAAAFLAPQTPAPHGLLTRSKRLHLFARPHPVAGVIAPWNFPLAVVLLDAVPALVAGCAVLLKPSEVNPLAVRRVVAAWRGELGLPPVWEVVIGDAATGEAVVDHADVVQFTGSTRTGRLVARRAAERLIPVGLELGGNDPMIVLADADLDRAANAAVWGALFNSGQACVSVERIYVEAPVHDAFVARVVERVEALRQGADDGGAGRDLGPMMTDPQIEIVAAHVDDALRRGARALTGGRRVDGAGRFFPPTVLVDVDHGMDCMREESFGPLVPIMAVADADEAIELANDSPYGLSATVWTRDRDRGLQIAQRLEVGGVNVNDVYANLFALPLPHGGWKTSGLGARSGGAAGVLKYCRRQAVTVSRIAPRRELVWYPYGPRTARLVRRVTRLVGARDRQRRLG